eukprot:TRINITY_DN2283_c0_g1_i1.p1 TRINITY_DN2283_c0_g1~~TRINITY_DN2283_c0_g1_i1.p1  ORF type:complete len:593 (+),score=128.30 TRINITY_DN2283_c0_g1_i1:68-1846(+)
MVAPCEEELAVSSGRGAFSGWLKKAKGDAAMAKWIVRLTTRFFTIDYNERYVYYSCSKDPKRISRPIHFSDILGCELSGSPDAPISVSRSASTSSLPLVRRAPAAAAAAVARAARGGVADRRAGDAAIVLRTRSRTFELHANSSADALQWMCAFNAARDLARLAPMDRGMGHQPPAVQMPPRESVEASPSSADCLADAAACGMSGAPASPRCQGDAAAGAEMCQPSAVAVPLPPKFAAAADSVPCGSEAASGSAAVDDLDTSRVSLGIPWARLSFFRPRARDATECSDAIAAAPLLGDVAGASASPRLPSSSSSIGRPWLRDAAELNRDCNSERDHCSRLEAAVDDGPVVDPCDVDPSNASAELGASTRDIGPGSSAAAAAAVTDAAMEQSGCDGDDVPSVATASTCASAESDLQSGQLRCSGSCEHLRDGCDGGGSKASCASSTDIASPCVLSAAGRQPSALVRSASAGPATHVATAARPWQKAPEEHAGVNDSVDAAADSCASGARCPNGGVAPGAVEKAGSGLSAAGARRRALSAESLADPEAGRSPLVFADPKAFPAHAMSAADAAMRAKLRARREKLNLPSDGRLND